MNQFRLLYLDGKTSLLELDADDSERLYEAMTRGDTWFVMEAFAVNISMVAEVAGVPPEAAP